LTLIIDAAPLVALADASEPRRDAILEAIRDEPGSLVIPARTTAEVDYLLGQRFGGAARRASIADLELGLADCALIVLAQRHQTTRILSFDERHLRAVVPLDGGTFTLLPTDG
jgi:uncharacterized protein